ncbi:MAG: circadian clock protein KaiA [Spirulinaceae cyanobacterium RM2_2_10]|nr:circadian clock protein KaiA [Spirulinaceae cyanobacterium SM2_1_0]NJO20561.1 circadian clock protein KaiA [Spirulinaceae cyanobacterium RM2_2_10]
MQSQLSICIFAESALADSLRELLNRDRYLHQAFDAPEQFLQHVTRHRDDIDCLILQNFHFSLNVLNYLYEQEALLPIVIVEPPASNNEQRQADPSTQSPPALTADDGRTTHYLYHTGEVWLLATQLEQIPTAIEQAIARFLNLSFQPAAHDTDQSAASNTAKVHPTPASLRQQQHRLADKLKERLGYLGVYYKRNPRDFFRNLSTAEQEELLHCLREEYREIILNYFLNDYPLNQAIDRLVNQTFFANLSVSQVLEIHMELMDEFAQQLKLEGRSDEILLDYRLALIDIIAHLCEMYRRSIPREDLPYEVFVHGE